MRLNLGCGNDIRDGYINVDLYNLDSRVIRVDLNVFPYPFVNDSFDEIIISNTLSHLDDPYRVLKECDRLLKCGGLLVVNAPTIHSALCEKRSFHGRDYLCTMYSKKKANVDYYCFDYTLVSIDKIRRHGWELLISIWDRVRDFWNCVFYRSYVWRLKKN